jgi:hypothetical protein
MAAIHRKPMTHLAHNTQQLFYFHTQGAAHYFMNSQWLSDVYADWFLPKTVTRPLIDLRDYATETTGEFVTLVNCNENKGGKILGEIAARMPDTKFMAVEGGYDEQFIPDLPNVFVQRNTPDIVKKVYARTRVLIVPSRIETWGRAALEACASGIPVVASPTEGLFECLGFAGLYCKRDDIDAWVATLRKLEDRNFYERQAKKCKLRAQSFESADDFQKFENVMISLASKTSTGINIERVRTEQASAALVTVELIMPTPKGGIGDVVSLDPDLASAYIKGGFAVPYRKVETPMPIAQTPAPSQNKAIDPRKKGALTK